MKTRKPRQARLTDVTQLTSYMQYLKKLAIVMSIWASKLSRKVVLETLEGRIKEAPARSCGHEVISVPDNEAAKRALTSIDKVDVFVVGNTAPEQTRKEMVDSLKANFPKVKIVALIPSADRQLPRADCNIVLNDWNEWLALLATAAS